MAGITFRSDRLVPSLPTVPSPLEFAALHHLNRLSLAIVVLGISLIVTAIVVRGSGGPEFDTPPSGLPRDDRSVPKPPPV